MIVRETVKQQGFNGFGNFFVALLSSQDDEVYKEVSFERRVLSRLLTYSYFEVSRIYSETGMGYKIAEQFLRGFLTERRRTEKYIVGLKEFLGPVILKVLEEILTVEVATLRKDSRVAKLPSQLTNQFWRFIPITIKTTSP